ncbi:MAG: ABC transporter substrate-binding protein [Deltaproteobacteria bacterium]|nr:ABC transporter substrate-binding protein [Deltaproteobacteria bacterium]
MGSIDATVTSFFNLMDLKIRGEVRDLLFADDYLPKPWVGRVVCAHKDFIREKPDTVRRMVGAILRATRFWKRDSALAIAKIKSTAGISEETAQEIYKILRPSEDGRIDRKALENASAFLIEYNLVAREKVLPVD